jgi:hypothetical protein
VKVANCVLGERSKKKFETVQLSNNTVKSHSRFVSRYRKTFGFPIYMSFVFSSLLDERVRASNILEFACYLFQNKTEEDF